MSREDRTVSLSEVSNEEAANLIKQQPSFSGNRVASAIPKFTKVTGYTNFLAEYALVGDNIVVHFFATPERPWSEHGYWRKIFPEALNSQGQLHFQATKPRLRAMLTEEMRSWWFEAKNYAHIIDLDAYMLKFFDRLDAQIDAIEGQP